MADCRYPEFYKHLMLMNESEYNILIMREGDKDESIPGYTHHFYMVAAYAGQLLYNIGSHFSYKVPCTKSSNPFRFEIKTDDKESLAEILTDIVNVFYEWYDVERAYKFTDDAVNYFEDAVSDSVEYQTPGLMRISDYNINLEMKKMNYEL